VIIGPGTTEEIEVDEEVGEKSLAYIASPDRKLAPVRFHAHFRPSCAQFGAQFGAHFRPSLTMLAVISAIFIVILELIFGETMTVGAQREFYRAALPANLPARVLGYVPPRRDRPAEDRISGEFSTLISGRSNSPWTFCI